LMSASQAAAYQAFSGNEAGIVFLHGAVLESCLYTGTAFDGTIL